VSQRTDAAAASQSQGAPSLPLTVVRIACVAIALAAAALWTARDGSDVFVMWLMAPYLIAATGRSVPTVVAAVLPAATGALIGPRGLAADAGTTIDSPLLFSTAAVLTCATLVIAAEALGRRSAQS
jgi:hypothetical protein